MDNTQFFLKRYYRLDLYSAGLFPLFLLYQILFSDNTKSVGALLRKVVLAHVAINGLMFVHHLFLLPLLVFGGSPRVFLALFRRRSNYGRYLGRQLEASDGSGQPADPYAEGAELHAGLSAKRGAKHGLGQGPFPPEQRVDLTIFILRHRLRDKLRLLVRVFLYQLFLAFVLTTNNSPLYLANYVYICLLFTSLHFGTIVHFIFFPNSDHLERYSRHLVGGAGRPGLSWPSERFPPQPGRSGSEFLANPVEDNIVLNYEHSPLLYKLFLIQLLWALFGVCFGNYLLLLDWYQLFARFPVTNYVGLFLGHLLSSAAANIALWRRPSRSPDHGFDSAWESGKEKPPFSLAEFLLR